MTISEFDLHVHSTYSFDSLIRPDKAIKLARQRGLKGIAITDHGTIRGGLTAKKINETSLIVIIGSEILTNEGYDIIGLFLKDNIKSRDFYSVIDEIRDQDGLIILPHPFRAHDINKSDDNFISKFDAIEGCNSRIDTYKNTQAKGLAKKRNLTMVSGSDAHFYGEIGNGRTIFKNIESEEDIKKSILQNEIQIRCKPTSFYYLGGSKIIKDVKTGNWHLLPYTSLKITIKGLRRFKRNL